MILYRYKRSAINLLKLAASILCLFLLYFPKAGIKAGSVPVTWGYLFLGLFGFGLLFKNLYAVGLSRLYSYLLLVPFQLISLLTLSYCGSCSTGFTIAFFVSFFVMPCLFLLVFSDGIDSISTPYILDWIKKGILFVAVYGIFLFFFKIFTGKFLEIPFLTMNYHDLGQLETKHINRGSVFKLISTYNNGNLFGVSLLMLLPLYCILERKLWKRLLVKSALVLTLSRTIWVGLVVSEFLTIFLRKNRTKAITTFLVSFTIIALCFIAISSWYFGLGFLIDANLGGRREQFLSLEGIHFFPTESFGGLAEVVYISILRSFGALGLVTFLPAMLGPLLVYPLFPKLDYQKAIAIGLMTYLVVAMSDGGILLIPVMAFYWFLASIMLKREKVPAPI